MKKWILFRLSLLICSISQRKFIDCYKVDDVLGKGAFGTVYRGRCKSTGKEVAVKVIKRAKLSANDDEAIRVENEILKDLHHPNIIEFLEFFEEPKCYCIVTELVAGGELFHRLVKKEYYSEKDARDLTKILLGAIEYCHAKNIVHRCFVPDSI